MNICTKTDMQTQEKRKEMGYKNRSMLIGIPKELSKDESRIALTPDAVKLLIDRGFRVIFESEAGAEAHFDDREFAEAGAEIALTHEEVFTADVIIKMAPLTLSEIELLDKGKTIFSSWQQSQCSREYIVNLLSKKVTAIAFEHIQDRTLTLPLVRSMSEISGNVAMMIASEYLSNEKLGNGTMLGGVPGVAPTEVVIIGAGTVGFNACRVAHGMGCSIKVFDDSLYKLRSLQHHFNNTIYTSTVQPKLLKEAVKKADVLISAKYSSESCMSSIVTEDMVMSMKKGSVIIDVSIDQGGCVETSKPTTHSNPVYQVYDVTHYCVPNIPSRVPRTASMSVSNHLLPMLLTLSDLGSVDALLQAELGLIKGTYSFKGALTNRVVSEKYGIPFQNIELLMSAFY